MMPLLWGNMQISARARVAADVGRRNRGKAYGVACFAASLTTIIAFFGLTAISGRFGSLIADIPFTVIAVLIASLVECFLILPNHMAHSISVGML